MSRFSCPYRRQALGLQPGVSARRTRGLRQYAATYPPQKIASENQTGNETTVSTSAPVASTTDQPPDSIAQSESTRVAIHAAHNAVSSAAPITSAVGAPVKPPRRLRIYPRTPALSRLAQTTHIR